MNQVVTIRDENGIKHAHGLDYRTGSTDERYSRFAKHAHKPGLDGLLGNKEKRVIVCGSAPSLRDDLEWIRDAVHHGADVFAVNTAHDILKKNGIRVRLAMLTDYNDWVEEYITPDHDTTYLIASQCSDGVWNKFEGYDHRVVHMRAFNDDIEQLSKMTGIHPTHFIDGGSTTGLRAFRMCQPHILNYGGIFVAGMDSSFSGEKTHAEKKPERVQIFDDHVTVGLLDPAEGKRLYHRYRTNSPMLLQYHEFTAEVKKLIMAQHNKQLEFFPIVFLGKGLLPDWAALHYLHVDEHRRAEIIAGGYDDTIHF